jgi:hypothetical protein
MFEEDVPIDPFNKWEPLSERLMRISHHPNFPFWNYIKQQLVEASLELQRLDRQSQSYRKALVEIATNSNDEPYAAETANEAIGSS